MIALLQFTRAIKTQLANDQIISDPLSKLAWGRDASFYELIPALVVKIHNESELIVVLGAAAQYKVALTFRASGTSLSGQSITNSVLVVLSQQWRRYSISENGELFASQPGVLGGYANEKLRSFQRALAAQPASIAAATVGGMAINNASGMNSLNTYSHLHSMKIIFADGTVLDTSNPLERAQFSLNRADFIERLLELKKRIETNPTLANKIRDKYRLKNTMGYNLKAFIDHDDPFKIMQGLMIGSEGTLAFLAHLTQRTVAIQPYSKTAFILFKNINVTARCIQFFKQSTLAVSAAELLDACALKAVAAHHSADLPFSTINDETTALLLRLEASSPEQLQADCQLISQQIAATDLQQAFEFSDDPACIAAWWKVRKGVLPSIGAHRVSGSTTLIEDVCYPIESLPQALTDLRALLLRHGYHDAVIFGHAMAGNMHFVFSQSFHNDEQIKRYQQFMDELAIHVVRDYNGSLKAEHGTGRNMAPFVRFEWGDQAYDIMREVKQLFDPDHILNPGVLLNDDPLVHIRNIKPIPTTQTEIDACIECGFCEQICPSQTLTFSPRQRIVARRALTRPEFQNKTNLKTFNYNVDATCAGCGLCASVCPVSINTGRMVRDWRSAQRRIKPLANLIVSHFALLSSAARKVLQLNQYLPSKLRYRLAPPPAPNSLSPIEDITRPAVIYFSSCSSRVLGHDDGRSLQDVTIKLLELGGFRVILPTEINSLCCGLALNSAGFSSAAQQQQSVLIDQLRRLSKGGTVPIYLDASACSAHLRIAVQEAGLVVHDSIEFISRYLLDKLPITQQSRCIAIHATCATQRLQQQASLRRIAERCAFTVVEPDGIQCCGFAGSKGFTHPELNAAALSNLRSSVAGCSAGYSTNRSCELGLTKHSGIDYRHIVFLLAECCEKRTNEG